MEPLTLALLGTTILAGGLAFYAFRQSAKHAEAYRDTQSTLLDLQGASSAALERAAQAERETERLRTENRNASERAERAERQAALTEQRMQDAEIRHRDHEAQQLKMLESAKAAVMEAGNQMSSKLLADHKQENEIAKKQAAEITAKLFEGYHAVHGQVQALHGNGAALKDEMNLVMRALTNPTGAGRIAEIGLENLLKGYGLTAGQDFHMQYHIAGEGGGLRPDAVLFLPQNTVVVIDSKASKHLLDLEAARGTDQESAVLEQFRARMREHAKSLAGKDYRSAIQDSFRKAGREGEISNVISLMYFPSESAIERLREDDPKLQQLLLDSNITLVGHTTLHSVCSLARTRLHEAQRIEGAQEIADSVAQLMDTMNTLISHTLKMGGGIKTLAESYKSLVASINGRALGRMRKLQKLGIQTGKPVPGTLPVYEVLRHEETLDLEAEGEDGGNVLAIR